MLQGSKDRFWKITSDYGDLIIYLLFNNSFTEEHPLSGLTLYFPERESRGTEAIKSFPMKPKILLLSTLSWPIYCVLSPIDRDQNHATDF